MTKNKEFLIELQRFLILKVKNSQVYDFVDGLNKIIENCLIIPKKNIENNVYFTSDTYPCIGDTYKKITADFKIKADKYVDINLIDFLKIPPSFTKEDKQELIRNIFNKLEEE